MGAEKTNQVVNIFMLLVLLVASIIGGIVIGIGVFLISQIVYLILFFSFAMGVAGGFVLEQLITKYKLRVPALGIAFGLIIGSVSYGTLHYVDYIQFRSEVSRVVERQLIEEYGETTPEYTSEVVDFIFSEETGYQGFLGYLVLTAREGVSIGELFGGNYINLGPFLTYVYWAVEIVLVLGIAAFLSKKAASRPFCETCDIWIGKGDTHWNCSN